MKKYLNKFFVLFIAFVLLMPNFVFAEKEDKKENKDDEKVEEVVKSPVKVYEFYSTSCPHCSALNEWFDSIVEEYGAYFTLEKFEVSSSSTNSSLMDEVAKELGTDASGVPFVVIGENYVSGFSEDTTPETIIGYIMEEYEKDENDRINFVSELKEAKEKEAKKTDLIVGVVGAIIFVGIIFVIKKAREE